MIGKMRSLLKLWLYRISAWRFSRKPGIEIGDGTIVWVNSCTSTNYSGGGIKIGNNCRIGIRQRQYWAGYVGPTRLILWGRDSSITIGDGCCLNGVNICARKSVSIGNDCIFAGGIQILDSDTHKVVTPDRKTDLDTPAPVVLGNNVWVGLNVIILKGTTIGDNSVVGAGAVVKGSFPSNCVIAGNPAKIVKRF